MIFIGSEMPAFKKNPFSTSHAHFEIINTCRSTLHIVEATHSISVINYIVNNCKRKMEINIKNRLLLSTEKNRKGNWIESDLN